MSDEQKNEPKAKTPFQFRISHIIYVTVAVALVSALWRVQDISRTEQYIKFSLVVLYVIVFLKCFSAIPVVLKTYSKRIIIYSTLGFILIVIGLFALLITYGTRKHEWIPTALFPFGAFVDAITKNPSIRTLFDAFVAIGFVFSLIVSQFMVYAIIATITAKKYMPFVICAILSVHLFAMGDALRFDSLTEYFSLFLLALFLFAFIKSCYFVPVIFERYNGKIIIHVSLAVLFCVCLSYIIILSFTPNFRSGHGVFTYIFPFASNNVYLSANMNPPFSFGISAFEFMFPASLAQFFIYSIILTITPKSKRFLLAFVGIIIIHSVTVWIVFRMDSFVSTSIFF